MIKRLRIKFVCIVMAIAMLMVGGILGVVIHFTGSSMEMQSISMMRAIAASPFRQGNPKGPGNDEVRLPFFTVQVNDQGKILSADGGYFDLTDREYLQKIVDKTLSREEEYGRLKEYDLRYLKVRTPRSNAIVFSDTTTETATLRNLFYSCLVIFIAAMVAFFGISILLSRWVIKPVEKAWNQQKQFVADASHELKTPLAVIMANTELLQNRELPQDEGGNYVENIMSTTYQMRSLVENMLEMARVDNGTAGIKTEPLDLSDVVTTGVLSVQLLYEEKGMGLRYAVTPEVGIVGSEQHLYQVMDILLDNALKYGAPGGMVSVDLTRSGRNCLLSVSSPGEPLSKEEQKNVFKRFYRGDRARTMNGSYGLGLSIAETIVEAHGGKIWAESETDRNIFYVQLPMS